jgi:hypothetical protein
VSRLVWVSRVRARRVLARGESVSSSFDLGFHLSPLLLLFSITGEVGFARVFLFIVGAAACAGLGCGGAWPPGGASSWVGWRHDGPPPPLWRLLIPACMVPQFLSVEMRLKLFLWRFSFCYLCVLDR